MSKPVLYLSTAEIDVLDCMLWIARDSERAALRFEEAVLGTARRLAQFPASGQPATFASDRLKECRFARVGGFENWLILYRETPDAIEVMRVVHGARDLDALDD
jgi:toxin ParE1/3/4